VCVFNTAVACRETPEVMLFGCDSSRGCQELLWGCGDPGAEQEGASKG